MLCQENVAFIKIRAKFCVTCLTFCLSNFLFFIFVQLLVCAMFLRFYFFHWLFSQGVLKTKKTLGVGDERDIRSKRGSNSKLVLVDINEFMISVYNYKLIKIVFKKLSKSIWRLSFNFKPWIFGAKYSRVDQVKFF